MMKVAARLPDPSPDEIAVSRKLAARLRAEILAADGFISFERFMELALYAPGLGYYVAGAHKFGAAGDFVTAPELTPLFGACLAEQCSATLQSLGGGIIEFGGGSGRLAVSVLSALRDLGVRDVKYAIVELSPELRARQRAYIETMAPELLRDLEWWQGPPTNPWDGVVIANEVIDALPVVRFEIAYDGVHECGVGLDAAGNFEWRLRRMSAALLAEVTRVMPGPLAQVRTGYRGEINLRQRAWVSDLRSFLRRGVVLLADYGYPRAEYYHPDRDDGTLQCYYRHRVHADPLWYPGVQDMTAAVDFSAVADAAIAAGFEVAGFAEQAQYLLACGITEKLAAVGNENAGIRYRATQAAKTLLLPQEMGTRLKFMTLTREYAGPVVGYSFRDARYRL
jgi:SAM-dependent MidA family methyltransferase